MNGAPCDSGVVLTIWVVGIYGPKIVGISFRILGVSRSSYLRQALVKPDVGPILRISRYRRT